MELPIAQQSYQPSSEALVRAVKRARLILARMVGDETPIDGAVAVSNTRRPDVRLANFATELNLADQADASAVVSAVFDHFDQAGVTCHTLDCAGEQWPVGFIPLVRQRGYAPLTKRVFLLHNYVPSAEAPAAVQVIPARAVYGELKPFYRAMAAHEFAGSDAFADQFAQAMIDRLDEPRLDLFIARMNGRTVAAAGVVTLGQIGVIDPAYTVPAARGQKLAQTLMRHVLEHCRRALFDQVLLERSEGCPSTPFYEKLGFTAVASYERYRR